jgi:radical SAM/Cys-rich protein
MSDSLVPAKSCDFPAITRGKLEILQLNLGYLCNLSCIHCHVNAGPKRTELMDKATIDTALEFIKKTRISTLDLTGGAPEMNPLFRYLVTKAAALAISIIDRSNLVILEEKGYEDLADFLAEHKVVITASLPCYLEDNVDKQRGKGVFAKSLAALKKLNALGYGQENTGLELNLVFNPQDAHLPPEQTALEQAYMVHLQNHYGIVFNRLYVLTNVPIARFAHRLQKTDLYDAYLNLLKQNYRSENLEHVMCRNTLSVDWQGYVYDCDFNQMLSIAIGANPNGKAKLSELMTTSLVNKPISVREHCYACTAGQGSSCTGALIP